jgi:hypothetical protein
MSELLVTFGDVPIGLERAFPNRDAAENESGRRTIELSAVTDLPLAWFGYDAVDVLVISASDGAECRALAADKTRFAALVRWVELGGKLVILCGGENAKTLLAEGGPLAPLLPGRFVDVVAFSNLGPIEHFAESADAIPVSGRGPALRVPRMTGVQGRIEVHEENRQPSELPVVVRTARGLGEITFAGIDPAKPPLADWPNRHMLLQALLRPYVSADGSQDESQSLVARGYDDLSGALRQRLGRSFAALVPIGFSLVAGLAIVYLLVLGPIDYLLVERWLRQPLAAWVTLPLIVLLFGTGAWGLAEWRKGSTRPRVNQLELVDVDQASGQARGTFWATMHSPRAQRFDLALQLATPFAGQSGEASETLLSWWGLPGEGIGGMQSRDTGLEIVPDGYRYTDDLESLVGVPVLNSATKSFLARWTAPVGTLVESKLSDQDGFATGSIVNRTGFPLRNARLLYGGGWGYWLGNLEDGQQMDVGEQLAARRVRTIITSSALGKTATGSGQQQSTAFSPEDASALALLNLMMFFDAAGGASFAHLPSQVQSNLDLSGLLNPGMGRAILIAEADGPVSSLIGTERGEPLAEANDFSSVVLRIVLPVTQIQNSH